MGGLPHLEELVELHKDRPFAVVGVNTDGDPATYRAGVEEHGVTWRSAFDAQEVVDQWAVSYFPTIYVLDVEGRIRFKDVRGDAMTAAVAELLAEAAAAEEPEQAHAAGTDVPGIGGGGVPAAAYEKLAAEHAAAVEAWEQSWRELKGRERIAARKLDPARDYLAEFEAMAALGDHRSALWVAKHLKAGSDLKTKELRPRLAELYRGLVADPGDLTAEVAEAVIAEKRLLERDLRLELLAGLEAKLRDKAVRASVIAARADVLTGRRATDDERAAGEALLDRLLTDYLDTAEGVAIWGDRNAGAFEGVGSVAPDFPAIDTAGETFRLSDYRGRVVMLDFWGFW